MTQTWVNSDEMGNSNEMKLNHDEIFAFLVLSFNCHVYTNSTLIISIKKGKNPKPPFLEFNRKDVQNYFAF